MDEVRLSKFRGSLYLGNNNNNVFYLQCALFQHTLCTKSFENESGEISLGQFRLSKVR